jgi:hypothetical protein
MICVMEMEIDLKDRLTLMGIASKKRSRDAEIHGIPFLYDKMKWRSKNAQPTGKQPIHIPSYA